MLFLCIIKIGNTPRSFKEFSKIRHLFYRQLTRLVFRFSTSELLPSNSTHTVSLPIQSREFVFTNLESSSALTSPVKSIGVASPCLNSLYTGNSSLFMLKRSLNSSFSFSPYSAGQRKKIHLKSRPPLKDTKRACLCPGWGGAGVEL